MSIRLHNTKTRSVEPFEPIEDGKVGLYTCGPTVWNYAHIGNLRTYVFEDVLRRTLEYHGYDIKHVMNVTDVGHLTGDGDDGEDKMIKGTRETGQTVWEIAQHYTDSFFNDTDQLNILRPHVICKATDHIEDMIGLIQKLDERGFVYESAGNLFFDTTKFERYGEFARLDRQSLKLGARIAVDEEKKNPADFALWFTRSKYEHHIMVWDSPWGKGYPGWHIECSAMSMKYLGDRFDIHCGGVDHIPVHHTNEIAQSEGATGKAWVNYWLHGEFLLTEKKKMAKSDGNFLTLAGIIDMDYEPLDYRYFCLGAHYRTQLQFSADAMNSARAARKGIVDRIIRLREKADPSPHETVTGKAEVYLSRFKEVLSTDLNAPKGLAELWSLIKDETVSDDDKLTVAFEMDKIFGLGLYSSTTVPRSLDDPLLRLISLREEARERRDYSRADDLREELKKRGIIVEDTPEGTRWQREK